MVMLILYIKKNFQNIFLYLIEQLLQKSQPMKHILLKRVLLLRNKYLIMSIGFFNPLQKIGFLNKMLLITEVW